MSDQAELANRELEKAELDNESSDSDRILIEQFVQRGLATTRDFNAFWGYFIAAISRDLGRLSNDEPRFQGKLRLASFWLQGFLENFFAGSAEVFYWQPERLRQEVYKIGTELGVQILPVFPYSPAPDIRGFDNGFWRRRSDLPGLKIDLDASCGRLRELAANFRHEYEALPLE